MKRALTLTVAALLLGTSVHAQDATTTPAAATLAEAEAALDKNEPKRAIELARKALQQSPDDPNGWFVLARAYHASGDWDDAIRAGHKASECPSVRASAFYNLACSYAAKGDKEDAFKSLAGAKRAGFADRDLMANDPDLASLRGDARFQLPLERNYFTLKLKDDVELPFSVDLPVGYDPAKSYPVLIAPGPGKKVEGNWGGLFWGEDTSQRGWLTVESPTFLLTDPIATTAQLMDEIARRYKVQGGKFHFACYGPTSGASFGVAMAYPERVKSLTALPGFPTTDKTDALNKLKGIDVFFIVGEYDTVWRPQVEVAHARLSSLGVSSYLEIVPNNGHLLQGMFGGELAQRLDNFR
jgi:hypothetical protein